MLEVNGEYTARWSRQMSKGLWWALASIYRRENQRSFISWLLLLLLASGSLIGAIIMGQLIPIILLTVLNIFIVGYSIWIPSSFFREYIRFTKISDLHEDKKAESVAVSLHIDDSGVQINKGGDQWQMQWSEIRRFHVSRKGLYLFDGLDHAYMVHREFLTSDFTAVVAMVRKHVSRPIQEVGKHERHQVLESETKSKPIT